LRQHIFELDFQVEKLSALISKSGADDVEKPLGVLHLEGFSLSFAVAKFDMNVDVKLKYDFHTLLLDVPLNPLLSTISMNVIQPSGADIVFISTPEFDSTNEKDLLRIAYSRVQKQSPDFLTLYEGINQNVDIKMSTLVFRAAPEPVLSLYDFIMTTFVSDPSQVSQPTGGAISIDLPNQKTENDPEGKIRVLVKLEGIQGM
jgi:vacuolar protein sorting-associated protein 13A/C